MQYLQTRFLKTLGNDLMIKRLCDSNVAVTQLPVCKSELAHPRTWVRKYTKRARITTESARARAGTVVPWRTGLELDTA